MSIFSKLFGHKSEEPQPVDHAVIVTFGYGSTDLSPLFSLESRLTDAIEAASAGEFDGNEVAADGSDGILYMYGPDADRLFSVVRPVLESVQFMNGARAKLRYGPPQAGVREQIIVLGVQS